MSDGQEKSDDLIAELAKLMASNAGEPEPKPGPKLVSSPEPEAQAPRPAAPVVRIPGMDAPAPTSGSTPAAPAVSTDKPATPAPTIRIPGMDQPVAAPKPAASPAVIAAEAIAQQTEPKVRALDFGTLPPAATIRPEPLSNWQDRDIPKPVAARPALASEPVLSPPVASQSAPEAPARSPGTSAAIHPSTGFTATPAPVPANRSEAASEAKAEAPPTDEPVIAGKPAPEGDGFDFDFGFDSDPPATFERTPPASIAAELSAVDTVEATAEASAFSADPIADLISAELDAADAEEPSPVPVPARPPVQAPTLRSFQPGAPAAPAPQQQRSVTTNPVRPPVAPPVAEPQSKPAAAEADRFATAPVFGLGSKPAAPAPAERDPMDEIESLIGEAVRVELSAPAEKPAAASRPQAAPVVPPLNTGFAPRRAAIKDTEPQIASAEAAILAAAAATAGESARLDGNLTDATERPYKRPKAKPEKKRFALTGGMRQYIGMAVAGTLLLAAGFGLYWVLGMSRGTDTEAPVLTADATPVKEAPPPAPPKGDAQGAVVFNELSGNGATAPDNEQLVSRDDSADTSIADVAETVGGDGNAAAGAATADSESELANRKVRTVTVRPDGTVVSGDDAVAGNEALPVDRPQVPAVPGADTQPSELLAALPDNNGAADPVAATINAAETPAGANAAIVGDPSAVNPNVEAPIPMARPADRSALGGGSAQRVAEANTAPVDLPADNAPAAAAPAPAVSTAGGAYVQLSSQPTSDDAQASLRTTQNRLASILNGRTLEIRQVDLGAKGTWYRVVLPVNSFSEATQTCATFKANGTDCLPING